MHIRQALLGIPWFCQEERKSTQLQSIEREETCKAEKESIIFS